MIRTIVSVAAICAASAGCGGHGPARPVIQAPRVPQPGMTSAESSATYMSTVEQDSAALWLAQAQARHTLDSLSKSGAGARAIVESRDLIRLKHAVDSLQAQLDSSTSRMNKFMAVP